MNEDNKKFVCSQPPSINTYTISKIERLMSDFDARLTAIENRLNSLEGLPILEQLRKENEKLKQEIEIAKSIIRVKDEKSKKASEYLDKLDKVKKDNCLYEQTTIYLEKKLDKYEKFANQIGTRIKSDWTKYRIWDHIVKYYQELKEGLKKLNEGEQK